MRKDKLFDTVLDQLIAKERGINQEVVSQPQTAEKEVVTNPENPTVPIQEQNTEAKTNTENDNTDLEQADKKQLLDQTVKNAVPIVEKELTLENWEQEFGENGMVSTPIGEVKMGDNQYLKMLREGRSGKFGRVKPTLEDPDFIVEVDSKAKDGNSEPESSFIFVKAFTKPDGSREYLFTSVSVKKEGKEVVISNQEKKQKQVERLLKEGKLAYIKKATLPLEAVPPIQGDQSTHLHGNSSKTNIQNNPEQKVKTENKKETTDQQINAKKGVEKEKKQAESEGGELLILTPKGNVGGLSTPTNNSSNTKIGKNLKRKQPKTLNYLKKKVTLKLKMRR